MAFTPFTLPQPTKLFKTLPSGQQLELPLAAGTLVRREDTETDTEFVMTIRYSHDGFLWERIQRRPKVVTNGHTSPTKATKTAPVQPSTIVQQVVNETAQTIHAGLNNLAARKIRTGNEREDNLRRLDKTVKMFTGKIWRVNYYIPTKLAKKATQQHIKVFKKHCVYHDDGSNWLFTDEGLNHPDVQEVFQHWRSMKPLIEPSKLAGFNKRIGVTFSTTELTPNQVAEEKENAKVRLANALLEAHESLIESIEKAAKTLEAEMAKLPPMATEKDRAVLVNAHNGSLRAAVSAACEVFERCLRGAELFDDTGDMEAIIAAGNQANEVIDLPSILTKVKEGIAVTAYGVHLFLTNQGMKGVEVPEVIADPTINPWQTQR